MLIAALVVAYVLLCFLAAYAGRYRRMGFYGTFIISLLITPLVMLLLLTLFGPSSSVEWAVREKRALSTRQRG
jgi:uncharacterized membrane protein